MPAAFLPALPASIFGTQPVQNTPGMTSDEAREGSTYSSTVRTSGDASTLDSIGRLLELGANTYAAGKMKPGDVPSSPDQSVQRTRPSYTQQNAETAEPTGGRNKLWLFVLALVGAVLGFLAAKWIGAVLGLVAGFLAGYLFVK